MKTKLFFFAIAALITICTFAQPNIYPAKKFTGRLFIVNGTVHVGNGTILEKTTVVITDEKISAVSPNIPLPTDSNNVRIIDATGKQVYPGLILSSSALGLKEIANGVKGSNDFSEIGEYNPSVRSIVAYNADSKIIGTLRANGILLANITPEGGTISGSSSVVQLDAWNWNDAAYKYENAIHLNMPSFIPPKPRWGNASTKTTTTNPEAKAIAKIDSIKTFFRQAKAYLSDNNHPNTNLKFEAIKGLFHRQQKLFIHANEVKQMLAAISLQKEFNFDIVFVGGSESFLIADLLKQNNIAVILNQEHALPSTEDDDVDQPYKTPYILQKAGVLFALNDASEETRYRNLSFNAGTAAAYGLTKEQALQAITLNAAQILGIADKTGSIEKGKDANIIITDGDILDMKTSNVQFAFIQGREVSLENKQTQLYNRYQYKYHIK